LGESFLEKMEIDKKKNWKKHGKLVDGSNLAHTIFLEDNLQEQ